jgi:hypothetical protein
MLSVVLLNVILTYCYAECHFAECNVFVLPCRVSLCWVSLCWMSLCWMLLYWVSWRQKIGPGFGLLQLLKKYLKLFSKSCISIVFETDWKLLIENLVKKETFPSFKISHLNIFFQYFCFSFGMIHSGNQSYKQFLSKYY